MPIYTETYLQISNRYKEWLTDQDRIGDFVTDVIKDNINRARQRLWESNYWDDLMVEQSLTLVDKAVTLPSNYGKTHSVFHDTDSDGKPDYYYYRDGRPAEGYKLRDIYDKDTGHSFKMTFYLDPNETPIILYQKIIDDFTGTDTEKLFFPGELLLKEAQLLHKEDADDLGTDYDKLKIKRDLIYSDYQDGHQFVNPDFRMEQNDADGNRVDTVAYDLSSGGGRVFNPNDNSFDTGFL